MSPLPLLQSTFYQTDTDTTTLVIFGGAVLALLLTLVIYNRVSSKSSAKTAQGTKAKPYSRRRFKRQALSIGLKKPQIKTLEKMIRNYKVSRPMKLLTGSRELDVTLSKALRDAELDDVSEEISESRKLEIYRIRQQIDRVSAGHNYSRNTKKFRMGQHITFKQANGKRYTSVITANLGDFFCAQIPLDSYGDPVKWRKGSKIQLFIWGVDREEISFETKVLGYTNIRQVPSVMFQHTDRGRRTLLRKYRRRAIRAQCIIYPVYVVETGKGRKARKKAVVVTDQRRTGSMIDISAGGCAMSCRKAIPRGELVKISFEPQRGEYVVVFGKIVSNEKTGRAATTQHVMFTKASSKNLNRINEFIYGHNFSDVEHIADNELDPRFRH